MKKLPIKRLSFGKWVVVITITIIMAIIGYAGYTIYNKQNEEKAKLLDEISSLKNEVENLDSKIEEAKADVDDLSEQNERALQAVEQQDNQINKESICRQVDDLLLEIKQACDIKPFPGVNECIEKMKPEYLSEEDCEKYGINDKIKPPPARRTSTVSSVEPLGVSFIS